MSFNIKSIIIYRKNIYININSKIKYNIYIKCFIFLKVFKSVPKKTTNLP